MATMNASANRLGRVHPRAVRSLMGESFVLYLRNLWPLFMFAAIAESAYFFAENTQHSTNIALYAVSGLLWLAAFGSTIRLVGLRCMGQKAGVFESYVRAVQKIPYLIVAALLFIVALTVAALLSIAIIGIPLFLYFLVAWFFASQAILIEGKGPLSALRRSQDLVRGHWWSTFGRILGTVLIMALILFMSVIAVLFVSSSPAAGILGIILSSLAFPIIPTSATLIYVDLRFRHEREALRPMTEEKEIEEATAMASPTADVWQCMACESVYNPKYGDADRAISPGTPFEELPDDWECASCGTSKDWFENVNLKSSGVEEAFRELRLSSEQDAEVPALTDSP